MKKVVQNIWKVLDPGEKKRFSTLVILDVIINLVDILALATLLWIIQFYIHPEKNTGDGFPGSWLAGKNSTFFITLFFVLFAGKNLAAYFVNSAHYQFAGKVALRISGEALSKYQQASLDQFTGVDSSEHIRKISFQPFDFSLYLLLGIQQVITQIFLVLLAITAILLFNAQLFLLLFIILLPPVIAVFYGMKKRLTRAKINLRSSNEKSFQHLQEALKGYVEGNVFGKNSFFSARFLKQRETFSHSLFETMILQGLPGRVIEVFAVLGLFILIVLANWNGNNDSAALLTIGAFMAAAYKIIPGIVKLINVGGQLRAYEHALPDFINKEPQKVEHTGSVFSEPIHSIEFRNVDFKYSDEPLLRKFSMQVKAGDFLGITGASGKGKTTILNLLLGLLTPVNGEISINAQKQSQPDLKKYWPGISYVKQQPFFIHDTILKNILLEEGVADNNRWMEAINLSGVDKLLSHFPEGKEKLITENGKNLSGGQQQRIAFARAMYRNAACVLLDEPFNELDELSENAILEKLQGLAEGGKIVIMITHDQRSLSYCNKIISLDES